MLLIFGLSSRLVHLLVCLFTLIMVFEFTQKMLFAFFWRGVGTMVRSITAVGALVGVKCVRHLTTSGVAYDCVISQVPRPFLYTILFFCLGTDRFIIEFLML